MRIHVTGGPVFRATIATNRAGGWRRIKSGS